MTYLKSLGAIGPALEAVSKVVIDPALPEVACHVLRLNKITEGKSPGPSCAKHVYTPAQKRQGLGLAHIVTPLRTAVWARQRPGTAIGIGAGVVGLIWLTGYWMGKKK